MRFFAIFRFLADLFVRIWAAVSTPAVARKNISEPTVVVNRKTIPQRRTAKLKAARASK